MRQIIIHQPNVPTKIKSTAIVVTIMANTLGVFVHNLKIRWKVRNSEKRMTIPVLRMQTLDKIMMESSHDPTYQENSRRLK